MLTRGPAPRVRALLGLLRPLADEVVLAVDQSGDGSTLDACADLADRRALVETGYPERVMAWLHRQCSCDWVFRVDDDEAPSKDLLDGLRGLLSRDAPPSMPIPRRWLYPGAGRFIMSHPWTPDYQVRLVRNLPSVLTFPGLRHENIVAIGEQRLVDLPIYHLDLLLAPLRDRRRKKAAYDHDRPDYRNEGFDVNAMYTPEDYEVETEDVPRADRRLIDVVLEGDEGGHAGPGDDVPLVRTSEIDRFYRFREVSPGAYSARIAFARPVRPLPPSAVRLHEVVAENRGDEWWPRGGDGPEIRLGYRWLDRDGRDLELEGPRTAFDEIVAPGQTTRVFLVTRTPSEEGDYLLEVDVVHENVRWFGAPARAEVTIRADAEPWN